VSFTNFLSGKILEAIGHAIPYSAPETWVGLLDDTGTELVNVDYARVRVDAPTGSDPKWSAVLSGSSDSRIENSTIVSFGAATVDWEKVESVSVFDAITDGNELMREDIPGGRNVLAGDSFRIAEQALKIRLIKD